MFIKLLFDVVSLSRVDRLTSKQGLVGFYIPARRLRRLNMYIGQRSAERVFQGVGNHLLRGGDYSVDDRGIGDFEGRLVRGVTLCAVCRTV